MVYRLATIIHSPLSHGQNIFLHFQDPPEVSSHYGSRLRLKVKDLSSKSGLGTKEVPRNQFLGCSSWSVILSDLPDAHPRHHRRTGPLNAFPAWEKGRHTDTWQFWIPTRSSLPGPVPPFSVALASTLWTLGSALLVIFP